MVDGGQIGDGRTVGRHYGFLMDEDKELDDMLVYLREQGVQTGWYVIIRVRMRQWHDGK